MKTSKRRYFAAIIALGFLLALPPAEARASSDELMCFACGDCHPDLWCTGCGIYAMYAISGCCEMGNGTTYCLNDWGGFAVNCDDGSNACQCSKTGEGCYSISG